MKRHVLAGLLAVATPSLAHAQASLPVIGWSVSSGHSSSGTKICTLFGGFGNHSGLAWVGDATRPPQHFTLFFDDGGAPPRSKLLVSQLMVAAPGSRPLFVPGTVSFGQFRTTLDRKSLDPLLHLFAANGSMTVALEGDEPLFVSLKGSADAAKDLRRCEGIKIKPEKSATLVHVAAAAPRHSTVRARNAMRAAPAPRVAFEIALPEPPPVAPALPAPAPAPKVEPTPVIAPAALKPPVAAAPVLPAPTLAAPVLPAPAPAPTVMRAPAPAPAIAPAALEPSVATAPALPAPTSAAAAQLALDDTTLLAKAIEDQFTDILQDGRASYQNSGDTDLSLGARSIRATDLCTLLGDDKEAIDWTGTISNLSSSAQGGSVLTVKLADGITVGTTEPSSTDGNTPSIIDPASDLFKTVSQMHVGERVTFSGRFFASDADCIKETSPTENGSMTSPQFLMKFTAVAPQR